MYKSWTMGMSNWKMTNETVKRIAIKKDGYFHILYHLNPVSWYFTYILSFSGLWCCSRLSLIGSWSSSVLLACLTSGRTNRLTLRWMFLYYITCFWILCHFGINCVNISFKCNYDDQKDHSCQIENLRIFY